MSFDGLFESVALLLLHWGSNGFGCHFHSSVLSYLYLFNRRLRIRLLIIPWVHFRTYNLICACIYAFHCFGIGLFSFLLSNLSNFIFNCIVWRRNTFFCSGCSFLSGSAAGVFFLTNNLTLLSSGIIFLLHIQLGLLLEMIHVGVFIFLVIHLSTSNRCIILLDHVQWVFIQRRLKSKFLFLPFFEIINILFLFFVIHLVKVLNRLMLLSTRNALLVISKWRRRYLRSKSTILHLKFIQALLSELSFYLGLRQLIKEPLIWLPFNAPFIRIRLESAFIEVCLLLHIITPLFLLAVFNTHLGQVIMDVSASRSIIILTKISNISCILCFVQILFRYWNRQLWSESKVCIFILLTELLLCLLFIRCLGLIQSGGYFLYPNLMLFNIVRIHFINWSLWLRQKSINTHIYFWLRSFLIEISHSWVWFPYPICLLFNSLGPCVLLLRQGSLHISWHLIGLRCYGVIIWFLVRLGLLDYRCICLVLISTSFALKLQPPWVHKVVANELKEIWIGTCNQDEEFLEA